MMLSQKPCRTKSPAKPKRSQSLSCNCNSSMTWFTLPCSVSEFWWLSPFVWEARTLKIWIYLSKPPMDVEFWQKSSKLKAQSIDLVLSLLTWGFPVLVPDHGGSLASEGSLQGEDMKVVGSKCPGDFLSSGVSECLDFSQEPTKPAGGNGEIGLKLHPLMSSLTYHTIWVCPGATASHKARL